MKRTSDFGKLLPLHLIQRKIFWRSKAKRATLTTYTDGSFMYQYQYPVQAIFFFSIYTCLCIYLSYMSLYRCISTELFVTNAAFIFAPFVYLRMCVGAMARIFRIRRENEATARACDWMRLADEMH